MRTAPGLAVALLLAFTLSALYALGAKAATATEYSQHRLHDLW